LADSPTVPESHTAALALPDSALATLTDDEYIARVGESLRQHARYPTSMNEALMLADVEAFDRRASCTSPEDFETGWALLTELDVYRKAVAAHYQVYKAPLNAIRKVVLELEDADEGDTKQRRERINAIILKWKRDTEHAEALEKARLQREADLEAQRQRERQAEAHRQLAQTEEDPDVQEGLLAQADAIAAVNVKAETVQTRSKVPSVRGHARQLWRAEVTDLKAVLTAFLAGTVYLDERPLIDAIQSQLNDQAGRLREHMEKSYPGVIARDRNTAVTKR
jgi:hypothetical protein